MTLISPTIQLAREEGELIGELKGEQKIILRLLNQRFGEIEPPIIEKIRKLSVEQTGRIDRCFVNLLYYS